MAALSAERNTVRRGGDRFSRPVEAATKIYLGGLTCLNAAGNAVPGSVSTTLKADGVCTTTVDNTAGAAGALTVEVRPGIYRFDNSAAGDLIDQTCILTNCYIVDDHTVAKTSGTSTRSVAGLVMDVDATGVWVRVGQAPFPIV